MEVKQIFIRKKSPKINSLLKEDNDSPRTPSPPPEPPLPKTSP